jgi:hypothetical protein
MRPQKINQTLAFSLTPGFSRVWPGNHDLETVSTVFRARLKTVETVFALRLCAATPLKQGVNQKTRPRQQQVLR